MKKQLLFVLLVTSLPVIAQKKTPGYLSIRGGVAFMEENTNAMGNISFGVSPNKTIGVGAGIGFVAIDNTYIPLTIDISYFGKPNKISPIIMGSAGYGVYKKANPYFTTKGGFTGSLNAGIALPTKYSKFFVMGGYSIYSFTGGTNLQSAGINYKTEENIKVFAVSIGAKIWNPTTATS